MKTSTNYFIKYSSLIFVLSTLLSCKKFISIPPPVNQVSSSVIFTSDAMATSALTGIYSQMMNNPSQFSDGLTTIYAGLSADELQNYFPGNDNEFVSGKITEINHSLLSNAFWQPAYNYIYSANACIEGINKSKGLSPVTKNQVLGEAKFIRAFCYFNLINLFGDVPLIIVTDYNTNAFLPRTDKSIIYIQIIKDLEEADSLLPVTYSSGNAAMQDRTRPNKWTVKALLSRAHLYTRDWAKAESYTTAIINSGFYSLEGDLNRVFLKNSSETIWQLQPVNPSWNTWEGRTFIAPSANANPTYILTTTLLNSFDSSDKRKNAWVGTRVFNGQTIYFPKKYKVYGNGVPQTEYYIVFRLAEQYLIRAEARAHQNNLTGSLADINHIRNRAGFSNLSVSDQASILLAIERERRIELFAEWGHRWYDLKRTGQVESVLGLLKPGWQKNSALWPIPVDQIRANPSLTQNPGY